MKKVFGFIAVVLLSVTSCGSSDKLAVRETCEKFIAAILAGDLTTAKTMVTAETHAKWGNATDLLDEVLTPEIRAELQSVKTKVSNVKVVGNEAQATLAVGIPAEMVGQVSVLHLKKIGRVWLIHEPGILVKHVIEEETIILDTE